MTALQSRIDELEIRLAHQEKTIADLNDVITSQWKKIESIERQLRRIDEEMQALDSIDTTTHQKPPHY